MANAGAFSESPRAMDILVLPSWALMKYITLLRKYLFRSRPCSVRPHSVPVYKQAHILYVIYLNTHPAHFLLPFIYALVRTSSCLCSFIILSKYLHVVQLVIFDGSSVFHARVLLCKQRSRFFMLTSCLCAFRSPRHIVCSNPYLSATP